MCLHSLSMAGEGGWEKRGGANTPYFEPGLYQSPKWRREATDKNPKTVVCQAPVGEGSGLWDQTEIHLAEPQRSPAPSIQDSVSLQRILESAPNQVSV